MLNKYFWMGAAAMMWVGTAVAQPPPAVAPSAAVAAPAEEPDAARLAAAKDLMTAMRFGETLGKIIDQQKKSMQQRIDQSAQQMTMFFHVTAAPADLNDYKAKMLKIWTDGIQVDTIPDDMAKMYAKLFTVDQLNGMTEFYKSPAGQALVDKTTEFQQASSQVYMKHFSAPAQALGAEQREFQTAHAPKTPPAPAHLPGLPMRANPPAATMAPAAPASPGPSAAGTASPSAH